VEGGRVVVNDTQLFTYAGGDDVRVVTEEGEPRFVAADVCAVLGLGRQQDSTRHLDEDEKGECLVDTPSGRQMMVVVTEAGLYSLILRSRRPEAKAFRRWITHEVLPQIRRTGAYAPRFQVPKDFPEALELAARQARELEAAREKVEAFDAFLNGKGVYLIDTVANLIGARHRALWNLLYDERILIRKGSRRRQPYAQPKTQGWFEVKTHPQERTRSHAATTTYVTPFGAEQIRLLAIKRGLIEPQLLALTGGA